MAEDWRATVRDAAARHPVLAALLVFLASRVVVYLGVRYAGLVVDARAGEGLWSVGDAWYHRLLRWDSAFYMGIAERGYAPGGAPEAWPTIVFYPLFPMLARGVAWATGMPVVHALLVVANAAALAATALLAALVAPRFGPFAALRAVAFLAFLPTSVFLSAAYTESVALALILATVLALDRDRHWLAALAAAFASLSRSIGAALVPIVALHAGLVPALPPVRRVALTVGVGIVAAAGLAGFIGWQWWAFGDPFAFARAQEAWTGSMPMRKRLVRALLGQPLWPMTYGGVWFLACLGLVVAGARRLPWSWTAFGVLALLIPYVSLGTGAAGLSSMPRFALLAFPAYVTLALLVAGRPWLTALLVAAGGVGLFLTTAAFSQWHWAG